MILTTRDGTTYWITKRQKDHGIQDDMVPFLVRERASHQSPDSPFAQILCRVGKIAEHKVVQTPVPKPLRIRLGVLPGRKDYHIDAHDRIDNLVGAVNTKVAGKAGQRVGHGASLLRRGSQRGASAQY